MADVMESTLMHINKGNAKGTHQRGLILLKHDYLGVISSVALFLRAYVCKISVRK